MVYEEMKETDLSKAIRNTLWTAQTENRITIGLTASIKSLASMPDEALFCFLGPSLKGDIASHMHEVLLKAFCFENNIYLIQVDSTKKLSRLLGTSSLESCALIHRQISNKTHANISTSEQDLINFCENYWDSPTQTNRH